MNAYASITITPILVANLLVEGEVMPVYVHVIDHPDARMLVDTGMTEVHPSVVAALDPVLYPLDRQDFDLTGVDIVVNTWLEFVRRGKQRTYRPCFRISLGNLPNRSGACNWWRVAGGVFLGKPTQSPPRSQSRDPNPSTSCG